MSQDKTQHCAADQECETRGCYAESVGYPEGCQAAKARTAPPDPSRLPQNAEEMAAWREHYGVKEYGIGPFKAYSNLWGDIGLLLLVLGLLVVVVVAFAHWHQPW